MDGGNQLVVMGSVLTGVVWVRSNALATEINFRKTYDAEGESSSMTDVARKGGWAIVLVKMNS